MGYSIVDRRKNDKGKSSVNRQRFIKRARRQLLPGIREAIKDMNIKDIGSKDSKKIRVPIRNVDEPSFSEDAKKGVRDYIKTGNDKWRAGDNIRKPEEGEGGGQSKASQDGEGEDDFVFTLTKEEFLDLFFEDLELPNIVRDKMTLLEENKIDRDGFRRTGPPSALNVPRTFRKSKSRTAGLRGPLKKKIKDLEQQLAVIEQEINDIFDKGEDTTELAKVKEQLMVLLAKAKSRLENIPFLDKEDLRYNAWDEMTIPTYQAVMFCILDVSGSMDETRKRISKVFFMLLYLFLQTNYEHVEVVYVKHHSAAKETTEHDFFYGTETGGTVVSTALKVVNSVIEERFPVNNWNIYMAHSSDGDNWGGDNEEVYKIMDQQLLPMTQYYAYLDVGGDTGTNNAGFTFGSHTYTTLWDVFKTLMKKHENLEQVAASDPGKVYEVFKKLFQRRATIRTSAT